MVPTPAKNVKESVEPKRARVRKIITTLKKTHPDAKLALNYSSPLELLIALILAAQARDDLVNVTTFELFKQYRTPADWASEKPDKLQAHLRRINFYRNKSRSIQNACRTLIERFGGRVPETLDELLALPGVGRKTANVLLGNAFGKPAIGVDTHVGRVSQRLGLTRKDEPDDIEEDLNQIVPVQERVKFCHLLQFHGRRVCTAISPDCPNCSITRLCRYPHKTSV
jgi:endonuclease-3